MSHDPVPEIHIKVAARYLEAESDPEQGRFVFSYTIQIQNEGEVSAQLLSRHWIIHDANGKVQEVRGQGVVGEQPHLRPGQTFQYTSGAILDTPVGTMQGSYEMVLENGSTFRTLIPRFTLSVPRVLH